MLFLFVVVVVCLGLSLAGVSTSSSTWNPASTADVFGVDYDQVIADVLAAVDAHALVCVINMFVCVRLENVFLCGVQPIC